MLIPNKSQSLQGVKGFWPKVPVKCSMIEYTAVDYVRATLRIEVWRILDVRMKYSVIISDDPSNCRTRPTYLYQLIIPGGLT